MSLKSGSEERLADLQAERCKLKGQLEAVRNSLSYRLGNMLIQAVVSPGRNTILLPYRLIRLCVTESRGRRRMTTVRPVAEQCPEGPQGARNGMPPSLARAEPARQAADFCTHSSTLTGNQDLREHNDLRRFGEAISGKYTEIRLADVPLKPCTAMIKEEYAERFVMDKGRLGGYRENDWRRIEWISSLLPEGGSLLDVGIGNGAFLNLVMSLDRFQNIVGLDKKQHRSFTKLFESRLYQITYASVTNLPFSDGSFDVVTCMEVLEHLNRRSFVAALNELRRVARDLLVVTVPYAEPHPLGAGHKLRFTASDLLSLFPAADFALLRREKTFSWMAVVECQGAYARRV